MIELTFNLEGSQSLESDKAAALVSQLRDEVRELPIQGATVTRAGSAPAGTRAGDAFSWTTLTVILGTPVVKQLLELVQAWIMRQKVPVKLHVKHKDAELIIEGEPNPKQMEAVRAFLSATRVDA